jgi:hypothetical protein
MQSCERGMGRIGFHVGKRGKINLAFGNRITEAPASRNTGRKTCRAGTR